MSRTEHTDAPAGSRRWRSLPWWTFLVLALAVFGLGWLLGSGGDEGNAQVGTQAGAQAGTQDADVHEHAEAPKVKWYTCSMHPQVKLQDPNAPCPICGMALIPVKEDGGSDDAPRRLTLSEAAKRLAEVRTAPVERRFVTRSVRLVGKIHFDETRMRTITARVPGRLDRLYVDYTGIEVAKGTPLAWMYSPDLYTTQVTLLQAIRAQKDMEGTSASESAVQMQRDNVKALQDRLLFWGLTKEQVQEIETRGTAEDHTTILSPIAGVVTAKRAVEGDYVGVGTQIYEIVDLARLWIYLDAYESDLAWLRYAQSVDIEVEAYPGEVFHGRIAFIQRFLDQATRTVRVRVNVDNVDGRLKPGMFVRARVHARMAAGGRIVEPSLAGKWISPVHPEIVRDEPGNCPICGTPLVAAESLGYVGEDAEPPLVVPATAPLRTGARAVVYVEVPDTDRPTYEGREVLLGPRADDDYLVADGLAEGERVVVQGNFKIDSALQILARPSMMSPDQEEHGAEGPTAPASFVASLGPVDRAYLDAQRALAGDDADAARTAFEAVRTALVEVAVGDLPQDMHQRWMDLAAQMDAASRAGAAADDVEEVRTHFRDLSDALLAATKAFGQASGSELVETFCPMAFHDAGASWLQEGEAVRNPYFGSSMLECGEVRGKYPSAATGAAVAPDFRAALGPVYASLLALHKALAGDDLPGAKAAAADLGHALEDVTADPGAPGLVHAWETLRTRTADAARDVAAANDLAAARKAFEAATGAGLELVKRFGHARGAPLHEVFCPMAFDDRGAAWLQEGEAIRNPYFGSEMLECGEIRATFEPVTEVRIPAPFRTGITKVVEAYLRITAALAADDASAAAEAAQATDDVLATVHGLELPAALAAAWREDVTQMRSPLETLAHATDLDAARRPLAPLSERLLEVVARYGTAGPDDLVEAFCPMAFDNQGASWLQRGETIHNPYFGAEMPTCGEVRRHLPPAGEDAQR